MIQVAIAFPTHNGARFLSQALQGALEQTYEHVRVVVVDDGSTDETLDIVGQFGVGACVRRERLGLAGAWNECVRLADDADLVMIAHQDDILAKTLVEQAVDLFDGSQELGFVHCNIDQIDSNNVVIGGHWAPEFQIRSGRSFVVPRDVFFARLLDGTTPVCCPTVIARRRLYEAVGPYDERFGCATDLHMHLRMALAGDVGFLPEPLYRWRRHPAQASAQKARVALYDERIRAKLDALRLVSQTGRFSVENLKSFRASVARDCVQGARRYATGDPKQARRWLGHAWALSRRAIFSADFAAGALRAAWSSAFGPTDKGRARALGLR